MAPVQWSELLARHIGASSGQGAWRFNGRSARRTSRVGISPLSSGGIGDTGRASRGASTVGRMMSRYARNLVLAVSTILLVAASNASAAFRTGHASVPNPEQQLSAAFPGLSRVDVRYDDVTGRIDISARLRSPLADQSQTSALRSTQIEVNFGDAWGDELLSGGSCDWAARGITATFALGQDQLFVDNRTPFDASDDLVVPVAVSADRRVLSATVPPQFKTGVPNFICLSGNMVGKGGFGLDAPQDYLRHQLFDGFDASDGNVGLQAEDSLRAEFRYLHNALVRRRRDEIFDVPGATARCSPKSGSAYVRCTARAKMKVLIGKPFITVRGSRVHRLRSRRDQLGGVGKLLIWEQAMRVEIRWARCPRRISARRRGRSCRVRTILRTNRRLRETVVFKLGPIVEKAALRR